MPALITSPLSPLVDANMNVRRTPHDKNLKFPPGLGYGGLPAAAVSSPALISPTKTRKRSGSVAYPSGCTFASGPNPAGGDYNPFSHSHYSRLGKRSSPASGLCQSWQPQQPYYRNSGAFGSAASSEPQPPSRSHASSQFFEFSTPNTNFDPFADEQLSLPPASSTSYSHYWEYDPSTNGPKLRLSPPTTQNLLASPRPKTAKLPQATPISLPPPPRTRSSSPPQPSKRITSPPLSKPDRDARSKLLAGILLNRIYAVGKPMRRRLCLGSDFYVSKEYVKSGLSRVVSIDC